jgi:hypothetical protein
VIELPVSEVKDHASLLARVYAFILSWPELEPDQQKTAPLTDLGGKTGKADGEAELPVVASKTIITRPAGGVIENIETTKADSKTPTKTNSNKETSNDIVQNSEKNNRPDQ